MNKSYSNSEINIALSLKQTKPSKTIGLFLMVLFVSLFSNTIFGQSVGDYRSLSTGNWITPGSWQVCTNISPVTWATATNYPGQVAGSYAVLIQSGHTIAVQNTGISTLTMGTVTISGTLDLIGKSSSQVVFSFATNNMIVSSGATIKFSDKSELSLPANANLQVTTGGLTGDCSNNQDINIGLSQYAVCVGGGGGTMLDFSQVMASGGTLNTTISSNSPICENETINLVGGISNTGWTIVSYSWSIVPPSGATITASTQNVSITNALSGTYVASLTVTAKYGSSDDYTNIETSNIIVNTKPATPTISAGGSTTFCTGGSVTLTSSAGTGYLWSTGATTQSISPTTAGSYTVQVTNAAGCQSASSAATIVTVNPFPVAAGAIVGTATVCQGQTNVGYSVPVITNATSYVWAYSGTGATITNGTTRTPTISFALNATSGNLTVYGVNACGNGTISANYAITVNPLPILSGTINGTVTVCQGQTNIGYLAPTVTNATSYVWSYTGTGATITNSTTDTPTVSFSGIATSGNLTVYGVDSCGNQTVAANLTVTVQTPPSTPTIGAITQPDCIIATGSVVLSGLPVSGTISQTGTVINSYAITGTTMTISGLAVGTYNFSVSNGSCDSSPTGNVVINSGVTKTWNGTWSPAGAPTRSDLVIINANYSTSSNGDLNACSLVINSGYTLTVEAEHFVIVQNNLTINGLLAVLDKGSLVMVDDAGTVTGSANIHRFTTPFKRYDYTYWSTPVVSTSIAARFTGWRINYAFEYRPENFVDSNGDNIDDNENDWVFASTMTPAKGYAIMAPNPTAGPLGNLREVVFTGVVNNGVQKITGVIPEGFYLLGNPYPSAIDADAFINDNAGVIDGTLYFWTHNTAIQLASGIASGSAGSGIYAFTTDDYASYNGVGGVATAAATSGGVIPSGKIASCQGFFTTTNATIVGANEIVFNNSMRLGSGGTILGNSDFFKARKPKGTVEKHRVWLNLSNAKGAFKQTLLGYVTGATNDNDARFDGETMDGNQFIDFYSINQDKNLVIQGRALPFDENDAVSLGYRTTIDGTFSIKIEQVDGILTNQDVFIEDKLTNTEFDLKSGNYTFSTAKGTFNDRFVLKYKKTDKTLGTGDFDAQTNKVQVSVKNKQIKINSFAETIDNVIVYDVLGRQIYQKDNVNSNELSIANLVSTNQVLIVKTTLQNGTTTTDKIVY